MTRKYVKIERTPEQLAELEASREHFQRTKPSLDELVAEGATAMPLGEVLRLHAMALALKKERERQGLTAAQLAERVGMDAAALSRLESGRHANPTLRTVEKIAAALGKAIAFHLEDLPPAPKGPAGGVPPDTAAGTGSKTGA